MRIIQGKRSSIGDSATGTECSDGSGTLAGITPGPDGNVFDGAPDDIAEFN